MRHLSSVWTNLPIRHKGAAVISIPVACLIVSLTTFGLLQQRINDAEAWVKHTQEVRLKSEKILRTLIEAETSVRGYMVAQKPNFLETYTQASSQLPLALNQLSQLVSDNPPQVNRLQEITQLVNSKLDLLQSQVAFVKDNNNTNEAALMQLVSQGNVTTNRIRDRFNEFTSTEEELMQKRQQQLQQQQQATTAVLWLAALIGVGGGLSANNLYSVGIVRRMRQLQDNAYRLAKGEPLIELIPGKDEISSLDQVVHATAEQISRRETLLREANARIAQAAQKEKALIENSLDVICSIDAEGRFVDVNSACIKLWGYQPAELIGRRYIELVIPEDVDKTIAVAADVVSGKPLTGFENRYQRKDDSIIDLLWSACWSESEQLMFCVARDNTQRKEVERLKNEFVSTVSHELRTPLTSLRGFSELLLNKPCSPEKQRKYITIMSNESKRLTNLINDFLDIQRIESGLQAYNFEPINLSELLYETAQLFVQTSDLHTLKIEVPDSLPLVKADSDRIRQVLSNLLSNAIKYSPEGGEVALSACEEETAVRISVSDQGMGMTPEAMQKLFTKFYRVDNANTRKIGGTGLGLSLVKAIVEDHGGNVTVESEPGMGSAFHFTLPKVVIKSTAIVQELPSTEQIDILLVVEDDPAYTQLLREQFEPLGLNVVSTAFAEQAVQLLEQRLPRLVLLDILLLGNMDGWDFLVALKSNRKLHSLPVLVITATEPNVRGLAFRGTDYLPKPVVPELLVETVRYHLPRLSGKTILITDDDADTRTSFIQYLTSAAQQTDASDRDVNFLEAKNGATCLQRISQEVPDLLILDLIMPEMDGFEVLRRLRADKRAMNLPVIVVTGIDLSAEEKSYLKSKMATLVKKQETSAEELSKTVKQILGVSEQ